jgi:cyclohexanone monooxygenase
MLDGFTEAHRIPPTLPSAHNHTQEERFAIYQKVWDQTGRWGMATIWPECNQPGPINDEISEWIKDRIREKVKDPVVAEKLVPNDHKYGMRREPGEDGYYEVFNRDNVELVSVKEDPIERLTRTGLKTSTRDFTFDVIVFATGWDVVTGPLLAMDVRGVGGITLKDKLAAGMRGYWHMMCAGFPNFYAAGAATAGITSRGTEPLIDWIGEQICHVQRSGARQVVPTAEAEESWMALTRERSSTHRFFHSDGWAVGGNIPGKPRVLVSPMFEGEFGMRKRRAESAASGYPGFVMR